MADPTSGISVQKAREHYDNDNADRFYHRVWAGADVYIGLGLYERADDPVPEACRRTVATMAARLAPRGRGTCGLELGSGYGAAARYLAREPGFHIDCLNLSEVQNAQNRQRNKEQGLETQMRVVDGNFEALQFEAARYDVVWSQDAFVHSSNRRNVFDEIHRVLKPGGEVVFTDLLQLEDCLREVLDPVLERFQLASLGSFAGYQAMAQALGWTQRHVVDWSSHLVRHYQRVLQEWEAKYSDLMREFGADYLTAVRQGMEYWVMAGEQGNLKWGLLHFQKRL